MKKLMMTVTVLALASAVMAATTRGKKSSRTATDADGNEVTTGRAAKILIEQEPKLGQQTCLMSPALQGASLLGQCYKKPRKWIVFEMKYATFGTDTSRFLDQLTFTWHCLLESKSATENKGNKDGFAPYSYFTCSTTYYNIPMGSHAASAVLPPSYLERFGEPRCVAVEISNEKGEVLGGNCWSEVKGIKSGTKFWEEDKIMNATGSNGKPMIERRQGLVDRSKTIWALVNPNDYETTVQQ